MKRTILFLVATLFIALSISGLFGQEYVVVEDQTIETWGGSLVAVDNYVYSWEVKVDITDYSVEDFDNQGISVQGQVQYNGTTYFYGIQLSSSLPKYWDGTTWNTIGDIQTNSMAGGIRDDGALWFVGTDNNDTWKWIDGVQTPDIYGGVTEIGTGDLTNEVYLIMGPWIGIADLYSDDWSSTIDWYAIPQSPYGDIGSMDLYVDNEHPNGILGIVTAGGSMKFEIGVSSNWELMHNVTYTSFAWLRGSEAHFGEYAVGRTYPEQCITFFRAVTTGHITGQVTLSGGEGNIQDVLVTAGDVQVNPDVDGFYSLEIEAGIYDVEASLDGYTVDTVTGVEVILNETTSDVDLTLDFIPTHGTIEGTVSMNGGEGNVEDVLVTAGTETTNPDASGAYSFYLEAGTYTVSAELDGYESDVVENVEVIADETTENVDLTLDFIPTHGTIEGTVSMNGGEGNVEDVLVTAGTETTNPDASGAYSFYLEAGTYTVSAELDGYESDVVENVEVVAGEVVDGIDLILEVLNTFPIDPMYTTSQEVDAEINGRILTSTIAIINPQQEMSVSVEIISTDTEITTEIDGNDIVVTSSCIVGHPVGILNFFSGSQPIGTTGELTFKVFGDKLAQLNGVAYSSPFDFHDNNLITFEDYSSDDINIAIMDSDTRNEFLSIDFDVEGYSQNSVLLDSTDFLLNGRESLNLMAEVRLIADPDQMFFCFFSISYTVSADEEKVVVPTTTLLGNYPNPFNPETTISYFISQNSNVSLNIYNMKGQLVKTAVRSQFSAGQHTYVWNGRDENGRCVTSGTYLYKLTAGRYTSTKKMILMK